MSGGRDKTAEAQQRQITQQQINQQQQLYDWSKERTAQMDKLQAPAINFAQGVTSGDPEKIAYASAVPIGNITNAFRATKENIYDSIPSGAAREFALASAERDKNSQIATGLNQSFLEGLNTLLNVGGSQGNFGLQQLGAGMRAGESALQGTVASQQVAAQRKAASMEFLGSLAGVAGNFAGAKWGK